MSEIYPQPDCNEIIEQVLLHDRSDPHRTDFLLSEVILGGQDGLVNVLGVILGLAAASNDVRIVIAGAYGLKTPTESNMG